MTNYHSPFFQAFPSIDGEISLQAWQTETGFAVLIIQNEEIMLMIRYNGEFIGHEYLGRYFEMPETATKQELYDKLSKALDQLGFNTSIRMVNQLWREWQDVHGIS